MQTEEAVRKSLDLVKHSKIALLGTNGDDGYPQIKAMLVPDHEGLKHIWFSTNTSSRRVSQLRRDPKACVYFVDYAVWQGLMLAGTVEILQDLESRRRVWHPGDEQYYPQGIEDPDYTVLRFTPEWGNYYHALANATFPVG